MKETLIVYGTRYGATPETCAVIQEILEKNYKQHVEIWNLENWHACPDLDDFDNIVIGSGIEYGEWTENTKKYLNNDFGDKKVAVFISSSYAGDKELHDYAYENFLVKVLEEYPNLKPVAIAAFGGRIPKEELPKFMQDPRNTLPTIVTEGMITRLHEYQYDNRNWEVIEEWAHKLGELFD